MLRPGRIKKDSEGDYNGVLIECFLIVSEVCMTNALKILLYMDILLTK